MCGPNGLTSCVTVIMLLALPGSATIPAACPPPAARVAALPTLPWAGIHDHVLLLHDHRVGLGHVWPLRQAAHRRVGLGAAGRRDLGRAGAGLGDRGARRLLGGLRR